MFDHEKFHVYQLQLEFIGWVSLLIEKAQRFDAGKTAEVRRHLDKVSLSVLFNIAEGNRHRGIRPNRAPATRRGTSDRVGRRY